MATADEVEIIINDEKVSSTNPLPTTVAAGSSVTVTEVTPGTGPSNLGKAEDSPHASGDVGVMALAVRSDGGGALAANGEYTPLLVDSAGRVYAVLPTGTVGGASSLPAGTNNIGDVDVLSIAAGDNNIGNVDIVSQPTYTAPVSGELAGSASATQMPNVPCKMVMFVAAYDNVGRVYIGVSGVTVKDGTTDTSSGYELQAGVQTPWIPVDNMNRLYRICNNAGDDLLYLVAN